MNITLPRAVVQAALTMLLDAGYECSVVDSLREALAQPPVNQQFTTEAQPATQQESAPAGEVVVTKNEAGQIVAVTRQDADGRVLSVIAESTPQPRKLTDEQIEGMKWHLEAVRDYEAHTGQERLKVEGYVEFARAVEAAIGGQA